MQYPDYISLRGCCCILLIILIAICFSSIDRIEDQVYAAAQNPGIGFQESMFAGGLNTPTSMEFSPDGRLFVTEKNGDLRVIENGQLLATPFFRTPVATLGEEGLLGVTFDPNFLNNHYVYIYYTVATPTVHNRVSRLTANGNTAVAGSEVILLELPSIGNVFHNGGAIHFGSDGKLYIAVGDHQQPENSQLLSTLTGKILRLNPDGTIPSDNPFIGVSGARGEIWAVGLRNPFTFAFDRQTASMFINDVGNNSWEEINQGIAGANYGWPTCEGPKGLGVGQCNDPGFTYPLHAYRNQGGTAVTGGAFYRGDQFPAAFNGAYFFADYAGNWIRYLSNSNQDPAINNQSTDFQTAQSPVDLKVGPDGALYYLSIWQGRVFKIEYNGGNRNPAAVITASPLAGPAPLNVDFDAGMSADPDNDPLTYSWNFGDGSPVQSGTSVSHTFQSPGSYTVTLTVSDGRGGVGSAAQAISAGSRPVAGIISPSAGAFYNGGMTISYSGTGTDFEDGELPPSAFSWTIVFHHDNHTHPFLGPIDGVKSGQFQIPQMDHTETNVWYRIHLVVRDSDGLQDEVTRDIFPNIVTLTLRTDIPGLVLTLDGQPSAGPITFDSVVGVSRSIGAQAVQLVNGTQYQFVSWSDGGTATHSIITPTVGAVYTAVFDPLTTPLNGLVGYWTFDEGAGLMANDSSGNANHGSLINDPAWAPDSQCRIRGCLDFQGGAGHLSIPSSGSLNTNAGFTISFWYRAVTNAGSILAKPLGAGSLDSWHFEFRDGKLSFTSSDGITQFFDQIAAPAAGDWHFVTGTWDGANKRLYLNSLEQSSTPQAIVFDGSAIVIGGDYDSGGFVKHFDGLIDDLRIYNRALTGAEVSKVFEYRFQSMYEADVAPRPDGSGTVVVSDWVQVGRFSVGLDTPAPGSEFQRADCAPRATLGDGQITVADWVQAGRYSVGLDPVTPAGGPTRLGAFAPARPGFSTIPRELRVATERVELKERTIEVPIHLIALGGESGLTFSLQFDPSVLEYAGVEAGRDVVAGSDLLVNDLYINEGKLGVGIRLRGGAAFTLGEKKVLIIKFRARAENVVETEIVIGSGPTPLGLAGREGDDLLLKKSSGYVRIDGVAERRNPR